MNRSPIADKTHFLHVANGQQIEVATLPKNIRFEIDTLDRIKQQRMDKLGELELIELAIHAQKAKIGELLKAATDTTPIVSPNNGTTEDA